MKWLKYIFALCFVALWACEADNCPPNALSYIRLNFADRAGNAVSYNDTLSVVGMAIGLDSTGMDVIVKDTLINLEAKVSKLSLPLSYANRTTFVIYWNKAVSDTIAVEHRNIPYYMSNECGTMMFYEIKNIETTHHLIDSVGVTNAGIDNNEKENVKIYFNVSSSL